ncbi:hypothetical protein SELMODRAFT_110731 [Selaginella moellendorffii]|uniref:Trafficking protein particle complex subunit n=2 Tax=Selaginella moellendorffii TaxID=88036 RepID=D8S7F6_SELML|nr:hypothetical protein SELMODRAFT_128365 [Selaginella moellendorffii]EFJ19749.1 hypothetical protein SELMODRAFT_110731 [Selaginella moellendorffii]
MRCLYIFNRNGMCLHYHVWLRSLMTLSPQQDQKLMFGMLFSLNSFTAKIDPVSSGKENNPPCSFYSFRTNTYKLHFMETASGIKIILLTDPRIGDLREALMHIYSNIYVEYVVKNPLYSPGQPFRCELFNMALDHYVKTLQ